MGNDFGGNFEENSGSKVDNSGWWLTAVEVPLFEERHVTNPVATKLDRGVVAFAMLFRKHATKDKKIFVRKLAPFIEDRIRGSEPMRRG